MPSLDVNRRAFADETRKLEDLLNNIGPLQLRFQKMVGVIVMVRLFSLLEEHLQGITVKILCNAAYLDATAPRLLVSSRSAADADSNMRTVGRARPPLRELKWTTCAAIKGNVKHLVHPGDPLLTVLNTYESIVDEMRRVRNHIAHNNSDTRNKFKPVVRSHYGAYVPTVTPAVLLLSPRRSPPLIRQYLVTSRILIKDLVRS